MGDGSHGARELRIARDRDSGQFPTETTRQTCDFLGLDSRSNVANDIGRLAGLEKNRQTENRMSAFLGHCSEVAIARRYLACVTGIEYPFPRAVTPFRILTSLVKG